MIDFHNGANGYGDHNGANGVNGAYNGKHGGQPKLMPYLAGLGFTDAELAQVGRLLGVDGPQNLEQIVRAGEHSVETAKAELQLPESGVGTIGLYLLEEQEILREAYQSFFSGHHAIKLLGSSSNTSRDFLLTTAANLSPNVMFMGINTLKPATVRNLQTLRVAHSEVGLVLLFSSYEDQGIRELRNISMGGPAGSAYLLKHSVDTKDQLIQLVYAVVQGRIIVDPVVMSGMIMSGEPDHRLLQHLSAGDLEMLGALVTGNRTDGTSGAASPDVKAARQFLDMLRRMIENGGEGIDARVCAALIYLTAAGVVPPGQPSEE